MIKSPEKQYNAYRVLKVLSNQDYLAVDYQHHYYLLSPLPHRRTPAPVRPNNNTGQSRMLPPREVIELDHIHYYVFATGGEAMCANAVDPSKFANQDYMMQFFSAAVRGILKELLMKEAKEARKYIDIKNAIICKGFLCLLELDRGKVYPRSIERSEKLPAQKKGDSLRKILENEFRIIRYFGLLLWEIIYRAGFTPKAAEDKNVVHKLLVGMVSKEITFEYLQIKLRDEEEKKEKKPRKVNFLVRSDNRYYTESMNSSNRRYNIRRVETEACNRETPKASFTRKTRVISEIKTGVQAIHVFPRRIIPQFNFGKVARWTSTYQSTENKPTFRSSNSKLTEKLAKQTEMAKNKFRKFLDSRFTLREEGDEVNEGLRSKLMSKIERFKTEHKSRSSQGYSKAYSYSQNKMEPCVVEPIEPRRLDFTTTKEMPAIENSQVNINESIELNQEMVEYINTQVESVKQPKEEAVQEGKDEMKVQFQQISFTNPKPSPKMDSDVALTQETVIKEEKTQQYLKRKKIIQEDALINDEIEVIKLEKSVPQPQPQQPQKPQVKKKEKVEVSCSQLQKAIEEYEQLIGILGHICSKAKLSKSLGGIVWQKSVYFLYERFLFERERFQQALKLGARQITRGSKAFSDQEWDLWLTSQHRRELTAKVEGQNEQIRQGFNAFAGKIVKEVKFDRKIEFYIRNRDKNSNARAIKFRESLSKLTISFVAQLYDTMVDERIASKPILHFFLDTLFGALIICELDKLLSAAQCVQLRNYERYCALQQCEGMVQLVYSLYFQEQ